MSQRRMLVVLRLYVVGGAPNSVQAIANLEAICREYLAGAHSLEIVDVLQSAERAMADGMRVTPTLAKLSPGPATRLVGNLSDKAARGAFGRHCGKACHCSASRAATPPGGSRWRGRLSHATASTRPRRASAAGC